MTAHPHPARQSDAALSMRAALRALQPAATGTALWQAGPCQGSRRPGAAP